MTSSLDGKAELSCGSKKTPTSNKFCNHNVHSRQKLCLYIYTASNSYFDVKLVHNVDYDDLSYKEVLLFIQQSELLTRVLAGRDFEDAASRGVLISEHAHFRVESFDTVQAVAGRLRLHSGLLINTCRSLGECRPPNSIAK